MLHSIASYKAAWQLVTKPFYWEKTEHGLTSHTQDAGDDDAADAAATTRPAEPAAAPAPTAPGAPTHQRVPVAVALAELAGTAVPVPRHVLVPRGPRTPDRSPPPTPIPCPTTRRTRCDPWTSTTSRRCRPSSRCSTSAT
ncbi:hypothetical protein ACFQX8_01060 [Klenkia terrae]|uniref:hypothetical protein n=1 Tax=Klenkia terrae TaxID=1052259 RepID=UPI003610ED07